VLEKMIIFGGALSMDGATVDKQALSNYVMSVPTVPKAVHMDLLNAAMLLAEGKCKNADYIAFGAITVILSTPGGGVHCVIVCGDTASDEVLAAAMIKTVPAGGCWKYIRNGPYSTSAEIHKKCFACSAAHAGPRAAAQAMASPAV
jgi:hypothetical protein